MTRRMRSAEPKALRNCAGNSGPASECSCTPVRPHARTAASISANGVSTKTPIFSTVAGNCGTIAATAAAVTRRGLGAKTNPSASAPASTASSASSIEVLPQILIQRLIGSIHFLQLQQATTPAPRRDRPVASGSRRSGRRRSNQGPVARGCKLSGGIHR